MSQPLLSVRDLTVRFRVPNGRAVQAVSGVDFDIAAGETLGLVGESGCGKSSAARALMQLPPPTAGEIHFEDTDIAGLEGKALRRVRPRMQMIFQDPIASLNPRRKIADIVGAPLKVNTDLADAEVRARVDAMLEAVGLDPRLAADRRPHEFSGGQCQRISIARAVILEPALLICDEPVSALDVSVQAQILNLLEEMKQRLGLTMLFISHDLAVVKNVSDRVAVMYLGRLCEVAPSDALYAAPMHPYTAALLSAIPVPDPSAPVREVALTASDLPSPMDPPSGCRFRTRCPYAQARCAQEVPELTELAPDHRVACHFPLTA
ncbi:MAG: ATP-binding cassette domain-containing protein [Alphaproteobacteria bacterium]